MPPPPVPPPPPPADAPDVRAAPPDPRGAPLRAAPEWFLGHGLGNDYLVFPEAAGPEEGWPVTPDTVRTVCDRHHGLGSDGVVVSLHREAPVFRLRMFNPDGSEFERSGNGLRVFATWARLTGRVATEPFDVEVGGGRVRMRVHGLHPSGEHDVSVDMGRARIGAGAVGFRGRSEGPEIRISLEGGEEVAATPVSVGNPHCVVFPERVDDEALERLGPALTAHPDFERGTNVQLAEPLGPGRVRALVWERGVGRTTSSGTSACAVATAAVHRGLTGPGEVEVVMEGGSFRVRVDEGLALTLRGPVRAVSRGRLEPGFVESLG